MIIQVTEPKKIEPLFLPATDTVMLSCLQQIMGELYATQDLQSGMAILGDYSFYVGRPSKELVRFKPDSVNGNCITMVPQNEEWAEVIEQVYGEHASRKPRYAIKKESNEVFDQQKLHHAVESLPDGYELRMIDEELYDYCKKIGWCSSWVSNYPTYELFRSYGMGAVILKDGEPVSGASSFSGYLQGIEVEIDTKEEYRQQGLAYVCASKLILECIRNDKYPSWDAANLKSLGLCTKLGYHFDKEYIAYEVDSYGNELCRTGSGMESE